MDKIDLSEISDEKLEDEIEKRKIIKAKVCKGDPIWCWQDYENPKNGTVELLYKITESKILCKDTKKAKHDAMK